MATEVYFFLKKTGLFTYGKPTSVLFFFFLSPGFGISPKENHCRQPTYLPHKIEKTKQNRGYNPFFCGVFLVFINKKLTRNAPKTHEIRNRLRATRVVRERERERERECDCVPAQARPSITPPAVLPNLVVDALSVLNLAPVSGLLVHLLSVCSCDQLSPGLESILMISRFLS